MFLNVIISLIGSSTIALFGWKFKAISPNGTIATIILGTILGSSGNIATWSVIIFLFVSSFFIQLFKQIFFSSSITIEQLIHEKKGPRDASQILANLLPAIICLLLYQQTNQVAFLIAYLTSIAGATADTWGSEIGVLSRKQPFDILRLKRTTTGMSGGISFLGTIASFLGSFGSIFTFYFFNLYLELPLATPDFKLVLTLGFLATFFDSFLGSAFQRAYTTSNNNLTEQPGNNQLIKGFSWFGNDLVNLLTNSFSPIVAYLIMI